MNCTACSELGHKWPTCRYTDYTCWRYTWDRWCTTSFCRYDWCYLLKQPLCVALM